ncbi:hypothetical protein ROG8370_02951 [Roseovarius gaetbuli]|uniref:Uncharacterized protein n=1 Tax=Roseovarius gaetbuli TaxID=1356575 RepID=A0A1X6ZZ46_9RHOB|nr:hypothetical protein [Roseovarius gaetbuli]SLN64003.1 hypothetical protein ROG8370_02951 [Roseovarius gaetbuli]
MSTFADIADKSGTICVGALAFALGDPSGGTLAATGMAGLAAIGVTLRKTCAKRACDAAAKATLTAIRRNLPRSVSSASKPCCRTAKNIKA